MNEKIKLLFEKEINQILYQENNISLYQYQKIEKKLNKKLNNLK